MSRVTGWGAARGLALALMLAAAPCSAEEGATAWKVVGGDRLPAAVAAALPAGKGPALLHFVDAASPRSRASLAAIESFIHAPLRDRGVRLVAIDAGAAPLPAGAPGTITVHRDADRSLLDAIGGGGIPRTVIVDAEGTVVYTWAGWRAGREAEWRLVLECLLDGDPVPPGLLARAAGTLGSYDEMLYAVDMRGKKAPDVPVPHWVNPPPADMGGKWRLVDFWATWCGPCIATLREAEPLHDQFKDRLVTLAVSDEEPADVADFVRREGLKQPIGTDPAGRARDALQIRAIPHALLINPEGIVIWQGHPGALWANGGALLRRILDTGKP